MMEAAPSTRFAQKNVLITGAAAGLGRHIARAFAAEGADIAILDFQDASATVREITALGRRSEFFFGPTCATRTESRQRSPGRPSSSASASTSL